ncbi:hypothetical protein J437_LFUL010843 [Ladona fulva]|uniref:Phospholipase B1, membrane-associated n=1 Tax=Ladona fulva TaxID=123851 RepID=A0A8K0K9N7_LADFU|nr:hypothetical protein J437_LFUL010843 [Ladona fulva]
MLIFASLSFSEIFSEGTTYLNWEARSYSYPPDDLYKILQNKTQPTFPCDARKFKWRSDTRPTSVHKLRPGDIDVIAAMGDSLTSANLARERTVLGLPIQDRGVSFTGGGEGTWHNITTLPNIIKLFNPKLNGYALGRGDFASYGAQLNVAISAAYDDDLFTQVKLFMKKMYQNPQIDYKNDWKLLSIMIGDNDVCSSHCYDKKRHSALAHKLHLQRALDYLYDNVPRLFVNVLSILDPTISARIPTTNVCEMFRRVFCNCLYQYSDFNEGVVQVASLVQEYQNAEEELVNSGRYNGREDFTVELQPFFQVLNAPKKIGDPEKPKLLELIASELPIWTPECFHLNQRGHAVASVQLWNNMLEPVGFKAKRIEDVLVHEYRCPTEKNPYFFTKKNTKHFLTKGYQ